MTPRSPADIRAAFFDVLAAIAPETDPAAINPAKPLRDQIDLDSMDFLNVVIRLGEVLGVEIAEKDYAELATLNGAIDYLVRRCGR